MRCTLRNAIPASILTIGMLTLGGCAVGPNYTPPRPDVPEAFAGAEDTVLAMAEPEIGWWRRLNDPTLDQLIKRAVAENHDLRVAQANIKAARALLGEGRFELFPIVTMEAGVSREKVSRATGTPVIDRTDTFYDAGFDAIWELDFFGRVRRSIQSLAADYQAALAEQRDVFVTVTAEVARTYFALRGAQYRLAVARRNADNQRKTYELTQALLEGGRGTDLDIARARAQFASTQAGIPPLETEVARAIYRLSVLVGNEPAALMDELTPTADLPALPTQIAVGDPAALLRRRPDIRAAERRLASATARIGVATADLFPRVSLVGTAGFLSVSLSEFGDEPSVRTSVGPFLTWPAFDLGRVRARIRAADASAEAQLATYEQIVLNALEETENAMVSLSRQRQRQEKLQVAAEASEKAASLASVRYRNGVDSFLNVLDAELRLLEAQDQLAQSSTDTGLAFVALYKALGGGWQSYEVVGDTD